MTTVDEFAQDMAVQLGYGTDQYSTDTDVQEQFRSWVKESYEEMISEFSWKHNRGWETLTLTPGSRTVELTDVFVADVRSIHCDEFPNLEFLGADSVTDRMRDYDKEGNPRFIFRDSWSTTGTTFATYPTLSSGSDPVDVKLRVEYRPPVLGTNDEIPLPVELLNVLRWGVRMHNRWNDDNANFFERAQRTWLRKLNFHAAKQRDSASRFRLLGFRHRNG